MRLLLLIMVLSATGCTTPRFLDLPEVSQSKTNQPPEFSILPGDVLPPITMFLDDYTNRVVVNAAVDDKGYIELPKVGKLHVAGMSQDQMLHKIRRTFKPHPAVVPTWESLHTPPRFYYSKGEVKVPGRQVYIGPMTLSQAIASFGGFTSEAKLSNVMIRRGDGTVEHYDCRRSGKRRPADPPVRPSDLIDVKRKLLW